MMSAARRDRILYATCRDKIAVAPNLFVLGQLPWVGTELDEAGLLFPLGRGPVRRANGNRTMYSAVRQLGPGETVTIDRSGIRTSKCTAILAPQPRFLGHFSDAVKETESLLRQIMQERLDRHRHITPLLSGGLDSSLLAWLASDGRGPGGSLLFLTSAAPAQSQIPDEVEYADLVARHLSRERVDVVPSEDSDCYRPLDAILAGASGPVLANRHCLTEAFQDAAKNAGATLIINGTYGELSATARLATPSFPAAIRMLARSLLRRGARKQETNPADNAFHVRLAPHRLARLPAEIQEAIAAPPPPAAEQDPELFGYGHGASKALEHPNEFYPGALRMDFPYRDVRLLRLFSGFPLDMLRAGGADRGIARAMLNGRVPDQVRLRRSGMPAWPDQLVRMQRQARAAQSRIAIFRKAEVQQWLDLDWLDGALDRVSVHGVRNIADANEVQVTAIMAEFLTLWRLNH